MSGFRQGGIISVPPELSPHLPAAIKRVFEILLSGSYRQDDTATMTAIKMHPDINETCYISLTV